MSEVYKGMKALSDVIEAEQDEDDILRLYETIAGQLETDEEKEAFKQGSLSMIADASNYRLRRIWHKLKFKRAMKKLQ